MKLSRTLIAIISTSALLMSHAVFSASNLNLSKSNIYRLDPNDSNAEKVCQDGGGRIATDKKGRKICIKEALASQATTVKGSKSNSSE